MNTEIEQLRHQVRQLSLLKEISVIFSSTIDQEKLLPIVFNKIVDTFQAVAGSLWLIDDKKNKLICKIAEGPKSSDIVNMELDPGTGVVGWVAKYRKSTLVEDAGKDERYSGKVDEKTGFKTETMLTAPLFISEHTLGAIQIINKRDGKHFSNADLQLLENIAAYAAAAIYNSKIFEERKMKELYERKMKEISQIFNSTLDVAKLNNLIIEKSVEMCNAEAGSIWMLDEDGQTLVCRAAVSPDGSKSILNSKMKSGSGIVGWVSANNKPSVVLDTSKDERFNKNVDKFSGFITRSMISVPISAKNEVLGVIQIINKNSADRLFTDADVHFLDTISHQAALAVKNTRLFESQQKVKELSAILNISREITSTLNIEHTLMTVVNLTGTVIENKRAAISLLEKEKLTLAAISGESTINRNDPEVIDLENIHEECSKGKNYLYAPSVAAYEKRENASKRILDYLRRRREESIWIKPLYDDEGLVGVFSLESDVSSFISKDQVSTIEILTNQITVALRNAMLYKDVPLMGIMEKMAAKKTAMGKTPAWKLYSQLAAALVAVIVLFFIPFSDRVSGEIEISCSQKRGIYVQADGILKNLNIQEGDVIKKGQQIGQLVDTDLLIKKTDLETQKKIILQDIARLRGESKVADYKTKELELIKIENQLNEVNLSLERTRILAPFDAVVLSKDLALKSGEFVSRGSLLSECADLSKVTVVSKIPEKSIGPVKKGNIVQFRVEAFQTEVFESKVSIVSVDRQPQEENSEGDDTVYFLVYSEYLNKDARLKPGMTGLSKITTGKRSLFMMIAAPVFNYLRFLLWF